MIIEMPTLKQHLKSRNTTKDYGKLFKKALAVIKNKKTTIKAACDIVGIDESTFYRHKKARRNPGKPCGEISTQ